MRFSFIVTIREDAATLGACLRSVLAVARPGDDVIVVDECSHDPSRMVIARATRKLPREHPLHGKIAVLGPAKRKGVARPGALMWRVMRLGARPQGGRAVAANVGLSMATGDGVILLKGQDRLDPDGFNAARAELAESGADLVLGRFTGACADDESRVWERPRPERSSVLALEAQPARMLLRRDFLMATGLRFAESPFMLEDHLFHWSVCLRAETIRLTDRVVVHGPAQAQEATFNAEALSVVFAHYQRMAAMLPADGPQDALRAWLARMVGRHLAALHPVDYWAYATAADRGVLGGAWPEGRGGRALAALSNRPLWQAVALWQAEAIWAELAEDTAAQDPDECPQRQASRRAIALWRAMRAGASPADPDSSSA